MNLRLFSIFCFLQISEGEGTSKLQIGVAHQMKLFGESLTMFCSMGRLSKFYDFINDMSPLLAQSYSPKPNFVFLVVVLTCIFLSYFAGSASRTKCDAGFGKSQR